MPTWLVVGVIRRRTTVVPTSIHRIAVVLAGIPIAVVVVVAAVIVSIVIVSAVIVSMIIAVVVLRVGGWRRQRQRHHQCGGEGQTAFHESFSFRSAANSPPLPRGLSFCRGSRSEQWSRQTPATR